MRSVKDDITVCVVMNDQNIIFLRKGNNFFIYPGVAMLPTGLEAEKLPCILLSLQLLPEYPLHMEESRVLPPADNSMALRLPSDCLLQIPDNMDLEEEQHLPHRKCHSKMSHTFLTAVNSHNHIRCQIHIKTFLIISTYCFQKFCRSRRLYFQLLSSIAAAASAFLMCSGVLKSGFPHSYYKFSYPAAPVHTSVIQGCKDFFSKSV